MPRMGRPTDDPKMYSYTVRLTSSEAASLQKCSEVLQMQKAEILRRGLKMAELEVQKRQELNALAPA